MIGATFLTLAVLTPRLVPATPRGELFFDLRPVLFADAVIALIGGSLATRKDDSLRLGCYCWRDRLSLRRSAPVGARAVDTVYSGESLATQLPPALYRDVPMFSVRTLRPVLAVLPAPHDDARRREGRTRASASSSSRTREYRTSRRSRNRTGATCHRRLQSSNRRPTRYCSSTGTDGGAGPRPAPPGREPTMSAITWLLLLGGVLLNAAAQLLLNGGNAHQWRTGIRCRQRLPERGRSDCCAPRHCGRAWRAIASAYCYGFLAPLSRVPVSIAYPML